MEKRASIFDVYYHLHGSRVLPMAAKLSEVRREKWVQWIAGNGMDEADWQVAKQVGEHFSSPMLCCELPLWWVNEWFQDWLLKLKFKLRSDPTAVVEEVSLYYN
uniref:Uncharacterized protein n=1 Tax=Physcomitrium patens TaxID=3218 RepID=A9RY48_PHYPA|nr:hypothetical protein PHYPA_011069 [Physcomitrium patens]